MEKISVIIPCYNVENEIDRCLSSLERQTVGMEHLEIICIDDCSTDGTFVKLQQWEAKYPENFMLIPFEENGRQGTCRNVGLDYASGEYIAFIDSDDWVEPNYLEVLYACIELKPETEVACCGFIRDKGQGENAGSDDKARTTDILASARTYSITSEALRREFFHVQLLGAAAWGKLIRKSLLVDNAIYFAERLAYEDVYWRLLLHFYAKQVCIVDAQLYHYFVNTHSTIIRGEQAYHLNHLEVQQLLYEELMARGLMDQYRPEIEYELFVSGYLEFMKIMALRFTKPPYEWFVLLQQVMREETPSLMENSYIKKEPLPELQRLLLGLIFMDVAEADFLQVMEMVRTIGL